MRQCKTSILLWVAAALLVMPGLQAYAQYSAFDDPPAPGGAAGGASQQEISPAKPEMEGGDLPQGQSTQVLVMMRNNSASPIEIKTIELLPSSNVTATIAGNQCDKEALRPGMECALNVSLKAESPGKYRVGLLMNHTGRTKVSNAAIIGTVGGVNSKAGALPSNEIEAFPPILDFTQVKGRAPLVRSISLRNSSTKTVEITNIELAASPLTGFAVSAPDCKVLEASQACIATVTWSPQLEGKAEGVVVLRHTGPSGSLQIPLTGEYTQSKTDKAALFPSPVPGQGLIVADRESVDFGTTVDGAASITVSLINNGDKPVILKQVKLAGSDNGLSLSDDDCKAGKELPANQGCALTINWLPRRAGPVIDDVQVIHDGARGVLILPVRGTATQPVNLNMPLINSNKLPKLSGKDIDEGMLKNAPSEHSRSALASNTASLNGYRVTSLAVSRAVVSGPGGRIIVEDGVPQVIAGGHWIPRVFTDGVELRGEDDSVILLFDRSLNVLGSSTAAPDSQFPETAAPTKAASSSSSSSSTTNTPAYSTPTTP